MAGWQRHLQSLVQVAKRYDCSRSASFNLFNHAKASFIPGGISSLPSLRSSLYPTMSRSPFLHMQKSEFTSTRSLLAAEGTKKSRNSKVPIPKSSKFPKHFKGRMNGVSHRGTHICFGKYALQVLECSWITSRQLEAGRRAITRVAPRGGKVWVRLIPDKPVTEKPTEVRMGRGKGSYAYSVAVVKPGRIIYEVDGVTEAIAKRAISIAASKMPVHTRFIKV